MAATVNANAASTGEAIISPRTPPRRTSSGAAKTSSPTWNQIVRGAEAESFVTPPSPLPPSVLAPAAEVIDEVTGVQVKAASSPEGSEAEIQPDGSKKPAWNKPYNAAALETGLVMGAVLWPTLSESTKGSPKPPSPDSLKNPNDALISEPQQVTTTKASSSIVTVSPAPLKQMTSDPNNPNATQHHGRPLRQKSMKREGGGNSSSNGGVSHHYTQSSSMGDTSHNNNSSFKASSGGNGSSGRYHGHNNAAARDGAQRSGQQRNFRRSSSGPHMRGDGSFGGRREPRDQEHGNQDWNRRRSFNGRDPYTPAQRVGSSGFIRPPPPGGAAAAAAYIPSPMQPYGCPMSIPPEMQPLYYFAPHPGMPFVAQMPPAGYYPGPDPQLHVKITNQIDYYFRNENLVKDTYLRRNMDEHGWVPVQLIANFKKATQLTTDIQLLLDAIRASTIVEIQGDKIRRRDDWKRWIMPPSVQFPSAAGSQSPRNLQDALPARVHGLSVDENAASSKGQDFHSGVLLKSSSEDMNGQPETSKEGRSSSWY